MKLLQIKMEVILRNIITAFGKLKEEKHLTDKRVGIEGKKNRLQNYFSGM